MRRVIVMSLSALALAGCQKKTETATTGEAASASAAAPAAMATRKGGLWTQTVAASGVSQTMKMCLAEAKADAADFSGQQPDPSNCAKHTTTPIPGGMKFESECDNGAGGKVVTSGEATGDFGTSYKVHVTSVTTGSSMPQANGTHEASIEAKYEGACPAGMKPGDMQLPNGMTINAAAMKGAAGR